MQHGSGEETPVNAYTTRVVHVLDLLTHLTHSACQVVSQVLAHAPI